MEQGVERYVGLAKDPRSRLKTATTPSLEERHVSDQDLEPPGDPTTIAATVKIDILYDVDMTMVD